MSCDYEAHLAECAHCRGRQQLHRAVDLALLVVATLAAVVSVLAFVVIRHFSPPHALWMELGALGLFALSALVWLVVAVATPAPTTVKDAALSGARNLHDHLPDSVRERLPEDLRSRLG